MATSPWIPPCHQGSQWTGGHWECCCTRCWQGNPHLILEATTCRTRPQKTTSSKVGGVRGRGHYGGGLQEVDQGMGGGGGGDDHGVTTAAHSHLGEDYSYPEVPLCEGSSGAERFP